MENFYHFKILRCPFSRFIQIVAFSRGSNRKVFDPSSVIVRAFTAQITPSCGSKLIYNIENRKLLGIHMIVYCLKK